METRLTVTAGAILSLLLIVGIAAGCGGSTTTVTQTVTGKTTGSTTTSPSSTESRTTGLADSGTYSGTAKSLVLSLQESKYDEVVSSKEVTKPSAAKRPGFQSGWDAMYRETSTSTTTEIGATIYVYDNQAHARNAYRNACPQCSKEQVSSGVLNKYWATSLVEGYASVLEAATCGNIYVGVVSTGTKSSNDIASDTGYFVGAIFEKAMRQGMARCNATKTTTKLAKKPAVAPTKKPAVKPTQRVIGNASDSADHGRSSTNVPASFRGQAGYIWNVEWTTCGGDTMEGLARDPDVRLSLNTLRAWKAVSLQYAARRLAYVVESGGAGGGWTGNSLAAAVDGCRNGILYRYYHS